MAELVWQCAGQREFGVQVANEDGEEFMPVTVVAFLDEDVRHRTRVVWWGLSFIRPWLHREQKYNPPNWVLEWWSDDT